MGTRQPSKPSSSKSETLVNLYQDEVQVQEPLPLLLTDGRTEGTSSISPMEVDEEQDEVVREIDVFVNPSLLNKEAQLCLMQYPLRPSWRPYELKERCTEVRVKPRLSEVEVVLSMDVNSENYDKDVAEPMRLQKQTLASSSSPSPVDNYAIGMLIEDQLHLNPFHAVLQFRPSLGHLNNDSLQKTSVEGDTKSDKRKLVSEDSRLKVNDTEPWVSLEYNALGSTSSCIYQKQMVARKDDNIHFTMKRSEYVKSLCLVQSSIENTAKVPSKSFLPSAPLEKRLKEWLREGCQVNRFDALLHLDYTALDSTAAKDEFLKLLQHHAYLVQGLWVSKSTLLFKGHAAVQRDYLLFLFSRNPVIHNSKVEELHLDSRAVKFMLGPLANRRPLLNDWKFIEERDSSFIKGHLSIVKEQEFGWSSRQKHLIESVHNMPKRLTVRAGIPAKPVAAKGKSTGDKVDTRSNNNNDGKGSLAPMDISDDVRESLFKVFLQIFKDRKARSINSIRQELQNWAISKAVYPKEGNKNKGLVDAAAAAAVYPSSTLHSVISQIAVKVHDVYVLESGENPSLDRFRHVVIKLFQNRESNAMVRKNDIKEAVRRDLKVEISDSEYSQVVKDLCVSTQNGAWLLRQADNLE